MNFVDKIKKAIDDRKWSDVKAHDSWSVFKIMSEFVNGYETLSRIGPCVAIFGSARIKDDNPYYLKAEETAYKLVEKGFGVITGGGPGIMEAGNKGAYEAGGKSVGLNIVLPHEQHSNPYIDSDKSITVVKEFLTTAADGKSYNVIFYSLEMIIAVGYRVRGVRGTQFRQWATEHLTEYLIKGFDNVLHQ